MMALVAMELFATFVGFVLVALELIGSAFEPVALVLQSMVAAPGLIYLICLLPQSFVS